MTVDKQPTEEPREKKSKSEEKHDIKDLHEPLLISIIHRIFSIPDLFAFSAVCRTFHSLTTNPSTRGSLSSRPPLLLQHHHRTFQTIIKSNHDSEHDRPLLPYKPLSINYCLGYSYGHLIFTTQFCNPFLINIFTGQLTNPPPPPDTSIRFRAVLTAPPSSPSCTLLLLPSFPCSTCLLWREGSTKWTELELDKERYIKSTVFFTGRIFILDISFNLIIVELVPDISWKIMDVQLTNPPEELSCKKFRHRLAECGGELLLVLFREMSCGFLKIEVHRLDFVKAMWVKMESLGDWCLFMDAVGTSAIACSNPTRWGGKNDSVYITGPGFEAWSVFMLDGVEMKTTLVSPLWDSPRWAPRWPSPVWVYPSMLL